MSTKLRTSGLQAGEHVRDAERLNEMASALEGLLGLLKGFDRYQTPIDLGAARERMKAAKAALAKVKGAAP